MKVKYTGATTLDLSSLGLGSSVAQNAIIELPRIKFNQLTAFAALSNFTDVTTYQADPVPFLPTNFKADLLINRPSPGVVGRFFLATDISGGTVYRDNGSAWIALSESNNRLDKWTYDFAVLGGVAGTIPLTGPVLPLNAVVVAGFVEVLTAVLGTGASVALTSGEGAGDIVAAAAISGAPWSTTGRKAIVPVWSDLTKAIKTTVATRVPGAVVTTANLTAGKFNLFLVYSVTD